MDGFDGEIPLLIGEVPRGGVGFNDNGDGGDRPDELNDDDGFDSSWMILPADGGGDWLDGGVLLLGPGGHGGGDDRNCEGWGHVDFVGLGGCDDRVVVQAAVSCSIFSFISMYVRSQMHGKCTHNMHKFLSQSWKSSSTIT